MNCSPRKLPWSVRWRLPPPVPGRGRAACARDRPTTGREGLLRSAPQRSVRRGLTTPTTMTGGAAIGAAMRGTGGANEGRQQPQPLPRRQASLAAPGPPMATRTVAEEAQARKLPARAAMATGGPNPGGPTCRAQARAGAVLQDRTGAQTSGLGRRARRPRQSGMVAPAGTARTELGPTTAASGAASGQST